MVLSLKGMTLMLFVFVMIGLGVVSNSSIRCISNFIEFHKMLDLTSEGGLFV